MKLTVLMVLVLVFTACSGAPRPVETAVKTKPPKVTTIGRSLEGGLLVSLGRGPTIKAPLPPLSDRCAEPSAGGDWVAFAGAVPVRLQLGASSVALDNQAQLPAATLWRKHAKRGCWIEDELFVRPRGRSSLTLKAPAGEKPATGKLTVDGVKLTVTVNRDGGKVELKVAIGEHSVGETTLEQAPSWVLATPMEPDSLISPTCVEAEDAQVEVEGRIDGAGAWLLLRCKSENRVDRVVLRYDAKKREAEEVYEEWSWTNFTAEGCDSCIYSLSQVFRRRWLGDSHALVFRDEDFGSAGGTHCEAHCDSVCDEGATACLAKCQQAAKVEAAKLDARCSRVNLNLSRWELVEQGEDTRITLWPRPLQR